MKNLAKFLTDISSIKKASESRPASALLAQRYGMNISTSLANIEEPEKNIDAFIAWLRTHDQSYLSNPHVRFQRSNMPKHMKLERKTLAFSHPYNPLSKMNYTPMNPLYELPLKEGYFEKVTSSAYDSLKSELRQVFKNRSCNFKNDLFFKDLMTKNRIGLKFKKANKNWVLGNGRLMDGTRSYEPIKGNAKSWRTENNQVQIEPENSAN